MKYILILLFLTIFCKSVVAQEAKARDIAVDSTLVFVDSVITLPIKQEVVILKQPKYLSSKPTEQSFDVLEKPPISPQISKRFTKYLKNKPFKKTSELTDREELAIVGGIFLGIGLCLLGVRNINSTKTPNIALIIGVLGLVVGILNYRFFRELYKTVSIGLFKFLKNLFFGLAISGAIYILFGIFGHLKLLFLWVSGGLITFGLIFMGIGLVFFVWAYFIDR
ncbi:MAG: hypothetical protein MUC49_20470 [Raineya sp.]|jgi:xanthosine utilization system XapX-like protein|nr:hypothetical protein [Raineya sp.]